MVESLNGKLENTLFNNFRLPHSHFRIQYSLPHSLCAMRHALCANTPQLVPRNARPSPRNPYPATRNAQLATRTPNFSAFRIPTSKFKSLCSMRSALCPMLTLATRAPPQPSLNSVTNCCTVALASPNSMRVFSFTKRGLSTPAKPAAMDRLRTITVLALSALMIGIP